MILALFCPMGAAAFDADCGVSLGYDDNVRRLLNPEGSAFSLYQGKLAQLLFVDTGKIDGEVYTSGFYNDFFEVKDDYTLETGLSLVTPIAGGWILPGLFARYQMYQNERQEEDDVNTFTLGGECRLLVNGRLTLNFLQSWSFADYLNPIHLDFNIPLLAARINQTTDQEDELYRTGLQGFFFVSPEMTTDLTIEYNRLHSSTQYESYHQYGGEVSLTVSPAEEWELSTFFALKQAQYDDVKPPFAILDGLRGQRLLLQQEYDKMITFLTDREDTLYQTGVAWRYFIDHYQFYYQVEWIENKSSNKMASYRQTVMQCGVMFSF